MGDYSGAVVRRTKNRGKTALGGISLGQLFGGIVWGVKVRELIVLVEISWGKLSGDNCLQDNCLSWRNCHSNIFVESVGFF